MYKKTNASAIIRTTDGAYIPADERNGDYQAYLLWATENTAQAADVPPAKTVLELDIEKYKRRADAKPLLMAQMAAMNIGRLKNGTWTTAQLVALMADPEIKSLVSHMETLSFEMAIGVVNSLTNPIVTPAIKTVWVAKLTERL